MSRRLRSPAHVTPPRRSGARRSGAAAVLAMIYVVLLSCLAVGFYATTTMSAQISANEDRVFTARLAGETGLDFMRYQLGSIILPASTPQDMLFDELYSQLKDRLGGTMNLGENAVGFDGGTISVPEGTDKYISLEEGGAEFRATISSVAENRVRVKVTGRARGGSLPWASQMEFLIAQNPSTIFSYGLASRGTITANSNARLYGTNSQPALGNVLVTAMSPNTVLTMDSNSTVSGTLTVVNPSGNAQLLGFSTVAGSKNPAVYLNMIPKEPEFPTISTSMFRTYAGNPAYGGTVVSTAGKTYDTVNLKNVLVRANTNPLFSGDILVEGVVFIETPNNVRFDSNVTVRGVIAVQDNPTGSSTTNSIRFDSNVKIEGVDKLPATSHFPPELRAPTGSLILAPKFTLHFNSNFGAAGGSIVGGRMYFDSNAAGTLKGSLIALESAPISFNGNAAIGIESRAESMSPAGMRFKQRFLPVSETYLEVAP